MGRMTFVRRFASVVAMVVAGMVTVVSASPVWAHIDLADSDPHNVSTVVLALTALLVASSAI